MSHFAGRTRPCGCQGAHLAPAFTRRQSRGQPGSVATALRPLAWLSERSSRLVIGMIPLDPSHRLTEPVKRPLEGIEGFRAGGKLSEPDVRKTLDLVFWD